MNTVHPNIYANSIYGSLKSPSNEVFVELQCSHFIPETQTTCFCGLEYKEHTTGIQMYLVMCNSIILVEE